MKPEQKIALGFAVVLFLVSILNYIPGLADAEGRTFGIFALDIYDDALHFASALWALAAAMLSAKAARIFLLLFGALYLGDGAMGLAIGVGYLDLGVFTVGRLDLPFGFKILANLPHIGLGGIALASGLWTSRR